MLNCPVVMAILVFFINITYTNMLKGDILEISLV